MRMHFILLTCFAFLSFSFVSNDIMLDRNEARQAFEYLNMVRTNPKKYGREFKLNLSNVESKPALIWNDILAKVAEEKALDMAKRNYFSHVTPEGNGINILIHRAGYSLNKEWIKNKKDNNFESIQSGAASAIDAINDLIIDEGVKSLGHRKHLLGIDEWNENLVDIGIGFVRSPNSKYKTYTCVIIAKHDW